MSATTSIYLQGRVCIEVQDSARAYDGIALVEQLVISGDLDEWPSWMRQASPDGILHRCSVHPAEKAD